MIRRCDVRCVQFVSNPYYTCGVALKCETTEWIQLRGLAPGWIDVVLADDANGSGGLGFDSRGD